MTPSYLPEPYSEWKDIDEGIHLEDTEKENPEMLKRLCKEVPEETQVGSLIRNRQPVSENK